MAIARQALNGDWFLGAMTDWSPRELTLDLSFLPEGEDQMLVWKDGPNADRNAKDFAQETLTVDRSTQLTIKLAKGGGYVMRLIKQ